MTETIQQVTRALRKAQKQLNADRLAFAQNMETIELVNYRISNALSLINTNKNEAKRWRQRAEKLQECLQDAHHTLSTIRHIKHIDWDNYDVYIAIIKSTLEEQP